MAKSKALGCAVQCCSSLVSWAVGDAKFFGNEKPNGPATCYWPAIAHLSSLFASISNWKFVWKFNQIQILATWGGHSWNGLTTDKRTVEHAYNGGRERWLNYFGVGLIQTDHHHHHHRPTLFCQFRNGVVGSAGPLQHFLISNSPFFATASSSRPSCPGHDKFRYATTAQTFSADGYGVTCFIFRTA
jgi:hypothetical protein